MSQEIKLEQVERETKWSTFKKITKELYGTLILIIGTIMFWSNIIILLFGGSINIHSDEGIIAKIIKLFL